MIIGLTGLAGAGKSTVAKRLIEIHAYQRLAFASTLKDMLRVAGFTDEQVDGAEKAAVIADLGKSPREIMQLLGTEFGREMVHPDFWIRCWERRLPGVLAFSGRVVVDDVRFPNEVDAIRRKGGSVWRVDRPGLVAMTHKSETQSLDTDGVIQNTGDLEHLATWVDVMAETMLRKRLAECA